MATGTDSPANSSSRTVHQQPTPAVDRSLVNAVLLLQYQRARQMPVLDGAGIKPLRKREDVGSLDSEIKLRLLLVPEFLPQEISHTRQF